MAEQRRRSPLQLVLVGGSLALLAGAALLGYTAPDPETLAPVGEAAALRRVRTLRLRPVEVSSRVERSTMLEARRSVKLFAETRGPVIEVGADELDRVAEGQLLLRIAPLLAEVAIQRAEAAVTRARSQLALERSDLERARSLSTSGVSSPADLEGAVNSQQVAAAALREAQAELVRARDDLTKKTLRAPFAGVLRSFPVEVGEYVSEGQQLAELLDLSLAKARVALSDREVVAVRPGQSVELRVEAYPGERFHGQVSRVGGASDADTRKFPVEVELPNAGGRLLPGMVATASLELGQPVPRLLVPRDATLDEFGLRFVYVVAANGDGATLVARRRRVAVRPLAFRPGDLEVVDGLVEGEEIAISQLRQLGDGERVLRDELGAR